jgi:hypothetical protein
MKIESMKNLLGVGAHIGLSVRCSTPCARSDADICDAFASLRRALPLQLTSGAGEDIHRSMLPVSINLEIVLNDN